MGLTGNYRGEGSVIKENDCLMTREEFTDALRDAVKEYIDNFDRFDSNPMLRVIPDSLAVTLVNGSDIAGEVEDSDEAVENAAAAQGMADQEAADYQVTRNPDFYPVKKLLVALPGDKTGVNNAAIAAIVNSYFRK